MRSLNYLQTDLWSNSPLLLSLVCFLVSTANQLFSILHYFICCLSKFHTVKRPTVRTANYNSRLVQIPLRYLSQQANIQGADNKLGQFFSQDIFIEITEIVCDTHWKAAHLWYDIM
jgi:hypothetical protein